MKDRATFHKRRWNDTTFQTQIINEVQQNVDQQMEGNFTEIGSQKWDDVVDIWKEHLPHFRGAEYTGGGPFLYDPIRDRYQYESESEEEDNLIDGNITGNGTQPESLCQQATAVTPRQMAEFITSIGLGQYSESFLENDFDGEMMVEANDSDLTDIVVSRLHRVKIITLFKRKISGATSQGLSVDNVANFLKRQRMDELVDRFKENGIDGDILEAILERNYKVDSSGEMMTVTDLILKEDLGVVKGVQRRKIKTKFKRFSEPLAVNPRHN